MESIGKLLVDTKNNTWHYNTLFFHTEINTLAKSREIIPGVTETRFFIQKSTLRRMDRDFGLVLQTTTKNAVCFFLLSDDDTYL